MNELNKLIEQYERENPGKKARWVDNPLVQPLSLNQKPYFKQYTGFTNDFVLWLASRPTCGKEQRLFLNELEKQVTLFGTDDPQVEIGEWTQIAQSDFENICDLQKVIKGK